MRKLAELNDPGRPLDQRDFSYPPAWYVRPQLKDQLSASEKVGVRCDPKEDRARQEFKRESETSTILARFGAGQAFPMTPGRGGEVDFDLDLQAAYRVVEESRQAWLRLPADVRARFRGWEELQAAVEAGEWPPKKAPEPAAAGAAGSGASASDSAPDAR